MNLSDDFQLDIPAGQRFAVIGKSGSGKSNDTQQLIDQLLQEKETV